MSLEKLDTIGGGHLGRDYTGQILFDGNKIDGMELAFACNNVQGSPKHLILGLLPMELLADGDTFECERFCMCPIFAHLLNLHTIGTVVHDILHTVFADIMHRMDTFVSRKTDFLAFHDTDMQHGFQLVALVHHVAKDFGSEFVEILFSTERNQSAELQASRTVDHLVRIVIGKKILRWTMRLAIDYQPIGYAAFGPCHDILVIRILDMRNMLGNAQLRSYILAPFNQRHTAFWHCLEMQMVGSTCTGTCAIEKDEIVGE